MVNALITTPVIPVQPGIYGLIQAPGVSVPSSLGIVALVGKASFGPLGVATLQGSAAAVLLNYGAASSIDRTSQVSTLANLAREAQISGGLQFVTVRAGSGGAAATLTIRDGSAVQVGTLTVPSVGVLGNALTATIRPVAGNATLKELVVFNGATIVQNNRFPATSGDEAAGLALATVGALYAVFTKSATGSGVLAAITSVAINTTVGVDPVVVNGDYTTAFALLSAFSWQTLVTDSEATAVQSAIAAFADSETAAGRFRTASIGEPTATAIATRQADATALNACLTRYIGNGYVYPNGDGTNRVVEGYLAAAQQAGVMSTLTPGTSLTWRTIPGALSVVGPVDTGAAIAAGMGYYESGSTGIRTGAGISTLTNPANPPIWALALHTGWKKLEHVATAFGLINAIGNEWDGAIANPDTTQRPPNTLPGWATLTSLANRWTKSFTDKGWLQSGTVIVDPSRTATSDTAYFTFNNLLIALRAERLVLALPFGQP